MDNDREDKNEKRKKYARMAAYFSAIIAVEALSYPALSSSGLNCAIFAILAILGFALSIYKLEYGFLLAVFELFIGSMGHLFVMPLGNYSLSIRMALWLSVLLAFIIKFIRQIIRGGKGDDYWKKLKTFPAGKYFAALAIFAVIGLINAFVRGHGLGLIFNDFNSWLYGLLLLPAIIIYSDNKPAVKRLQEIFLVAAIWISLKTLLLLFVFTHNLVFAPAIYHWLRDTLVGEMTATLSGWPRIFIQGQIFSGLALFLVFWKNIAGCKNGQKADWRKNVPELILTALFASTLLISFSRSFWAALIAASGLSLAAAAYFYSWRRALAYSGWLIISFALGFAIIYLTAIFPFPAPGKFNADFAGRITNGQEAAVSSRWSLLPVLMKEIKKEPILGQGYGATVTYISSDPRILEKDPSGTYTTYAFEWGYLDLWLKIGFLGLAAYLTLLFYLIKTAVLSARKNNDWLLFGLAAGLIFLAATNFFTPYLNHPLGLGIILISSCLIRKDRVY